MPISRVAVSNFKSFAEIDVALGPFTVLVGANGSGKSNFINIFRFVRDITRFGLDNAISLQGGSEYLRNIHIGATEALTIEIVSNDHVGFRRPAPRRGQIEVVVDATKYRFSITFHKRGSGYTIAEDVVTQDWRIFSRPDREHPARSVELGVGTMTLRNDKSRVRSTLSLSEEIEDLQERLMPPYLRDERGRRGSLLLEQPFLGFGPPWSRSLERIAIYDFDPKLPKKAVPITGKLDLEEDGSNLAIVLNGVLSKRANKSQFVNLLADLLPFVDNVGIEKFADTSLLFKLAERYGPRKYFPASLISDGTINVTALMVALFFEDSSVAIIEEPERNLHPSLISKVVNLMQEASRDARKQLLVSTHHPDLVGHARLEELLLLKRTDEGYSTVVRPAESKRVREFLKSELGVERMFAQNLLGL
jgi:predicted ATPase